MSIASEIERIQTNVTNSLDAVASYGVEVPEGANSNDLPEAINNIGTKIPTKTSQLENDSGFLTEVPKEIMLINVTLNDDGTYSVDKSYEEISKAVYSGRQCIALNNDLMYLYHSHVYDGVAFSTVITPSGAYAYTLVIRSDGTVSEDKYTFALAKDLHSHDVTTATLFASDWDSTTKQQEVSVPIVTAPDKTITYVYPVTDKDNIKNIANSGVICVKEAPGRLTFEAERIPDVALTFIIEVCPISYTYENCITLHDVDTGTSVVCRSSDATYWSSWVSSAYNTVGAKLTGVGTISVDGNELFYDASRNNVVKSTDRVLAGQVYYYADGGAGAPE